jgi:NitT/TauT family transport system substrate-binding protein
LALGGVSDDEVTWVELTFPDQAAGFANGTVDAALSSEPLATLITERGLAVRWHAVADFLPGASTAFMSYAPGFMQDQPEAARRFMAAYLRGARDYNGAFRRGENRDEAVQILIKHTTVKDPALYDRMGFPLIDPNGAINVPNVADQAVWYGEQGLLQGAIDVTSLMDTSYLNAALARLGPYQP